ncbi:MAG: hypothetical protein ACI97A_003892 [Planctomycetota bacterium]|jgi:hypothetical protein
MSNEKHGKMWLRLMIGGGIALAIAKLAGHSLPGWIHTTLMGLGGLAVVFGSSEVMIEAVEGYAAKKKMSTFVAGTMAGLASNIPELVMLGFVLAATPIVGFVVSVLTLHVGAAAFGLYCGFLPRDVEGQASMPKPLVKLSTDLYAAAAGAFFSIGTIFVLMNSFSVSGQDVAEIGASDLYVMGACLLLVQVVAVTRLVKRFSGGGVDAENQPAPDTTHAGMGMGTIVGYSIIGLIGAVIGGHSVGDFATVLVASLNEAGYSEMFGAMILSAFSASGAFVMIGTAHFKGKYDIAMANASGAVTQVPFLVLPIAFIMLAIFSQTGVIATLPHGGVIPIDIHSTSAILLGFPSMLILWKAVQDDGKVNWLETTSMISIFFLVMYLMVAHG